MAVLLLLSVASLTKTITPSLTYSQPKPATASLCFVSFLFRTKHLRKIASSSNKARLFLVKAIKESNESVEDSVTTKKAEVEAPTSEESELSVIGTDIKKAMKEREATSDSLAGRVVEEIREIDWPTFGKVLRTTGVVLGVINGSDVTDGEICIGNLGSKAVKG